MGACAAIDAIVRWARLLLAVAGRARCCARRCSESGDSRRSGNDYECQRTEAREESM
jgi:hypothetical protein